MKQKFLLIPAFAVVTLAAYTLTLSYTNTPSLINQLEALANGEGGENGDGETGGNNGESGDKEESGNQGGSETLIKSQQKPGHTTKLCPAYEVTQTWTQASDGTWGWSTTETYVGMKSFPVIDCEKGTSTCTPYKPC